MNLTNKLLTIKNLYKSYFNTKGETKVLNNINFELYEGESLCIIGPSGCGKSSILNIISSLDKEYYGKVLLKENIKIGYMFQEDALFSWLNIHDNATIGLKISKNYTDEAKEYVDNLLKKYNLYEFKDKYPNELSGGMKQRLALIRTLALKPDILLLDEPFSALDYQTRLKVSEDVFNIIKNENKTIIMVTHDINEAIKYSSKIIVLSSLPAKIINAYNTINYDKDKLFDFIWKDLNSDI